MFDFDKTSMKPKADEPYKLKTYINGIFNYVKTWKRVWNIEKRRKSTDYFTNIFVKRCYSHKRINWLFYQYFGFINLQNYNKNWKTNTEKFDLNSIILKTINITNNFSRNIYEKFQKNRFCEISSVSDKIQHGEQLNTIKKDHSIIMQSNQHVYNLNFINSLEMSSDWKKDLIHNKRK